MAKKKRRRNRKKPKAHGPLWQVKVQPITGHATQLKVVDPTLMASQDKAQPQASLHVVRPSTG